MKNLIVLFTIFVSLISEAQQLPQYTLYQLNDYAINPAVAGSRFQTELKANNRYQWQGLNDNPRTYTLTAHTASLNGKMGYGGLLYTDVVGPSRRIGLQGSFAYHFEITESIKISLALSAGLLEYALDGHKINLENANDPALVNALGSSLMFDAKAGLLVYSDKFYFGIAAPQIIENELELFDNMATGQSVTKMHLMVHGGYRYAINEDFTLEPSLLLKFVQPLPIKIEGTLTIHYKNIFWLGSSYRSNDAVTAMIGTKLQNKIIFGYGHDFTQSDLRKYSSGSNEIMVGFIIGKQVAVSSSEIED